MFLAAKSSIPRSVWSWPRSQQWWHDIQNGRYGTCWWKDNLNTPLLFFVNNYDPTSKNKTTCLRESDSVKKRVAVTIWKLAQIYLVSDSLLFVLLFIVVETCTVTATKLLNKFVYIPQGESLREVVRGIQEWLGNPTNGWRYRRFAHSHYQTIRQCF